MTKSSDDLPSGAFSSANPAEFLAQFGRSRGLGGLGDINGLVQEPERSAVSDCLFCDPARSRIVGQYAGWYARLDNFPATQGHVEIVPFRHVESLFAVPFAELAAGFSLLRQMVDLIESTRKVEGWNIGVNDGPAAGQTIPHLHIHLIPRQIGDQDDPRGGVRRGLPNGDPDIWSTEEIR